ncbi:hypothetical protein EJ08DRAFT_700027 [Tothia fuscella]|uniref:F-box domain-containing protein n=1 Tax=Tothia fuscella TaxID=1048955 RepID=A0A9P4NL99_9PEZI|nr:hypothetical protein EJ08DRAFT_700027 [Tothia fuscella]
MPLDDLPTEIIEGIASFLFYDHDLSSLRQTCQTISNQIFKFYAGRMVATRRHHSRIFAEFEIEKFDGPAPEHDGYEDCDWTVKSMPGVPYEQEKDCFPEQAVKIEPLLRKSPEQFKNLKTVTFEPQREIAYGAWMVSDDWNHNWHHNWKMVQTAQKYATTIINAVMKSNNSMENFSVFYDSQMHWEIGSTQSATVWCLPRDSFASFGLASSIHKMGSTLTSLRRLDIALGCGVKQSHQVATAWKFTVKMITSMVNLGDISLSFSSGGNAYEAPTFLALFVDGLLKNLSAPKLQSLTLQGFFIASVQNTVSIIARHAQLRHVTLRYHTVVGTPRGFVPVFAALKRKTLLESVTFEALQWEGGLGLLCFEGTCTVTTGNPKINRCTDGSVKAVGGEVRPLLMKLSGIQQKALVSGQLG